VQKHANITYVHCKIFKKSSPLQLYAIFSLWLTCVIENYLGNTAQPYQINVINLLCILLFWPFYFD